GRTMILGGPGRLLRGVPRVSRFITSAGAGELSYMTPKISGPLSHCAIFGGPRSLLRARGPRLFVSTLILASLTSSRTTLMRHAS
ncbi:hypothetical protein FA95DRAFT_1561756, partial [Auriscalpium vulgare]